MASFRDSPMHSQLSEADVIFNRTNVALARSRRLIESWLPPRQENANSNNTVTEDDDEEDFRGMTEAGGIGSKRAYDDDKLTNGILKKKISSDDRLLEQLIGKKAAKARKKSQEAQKSMSMSKHAAPKMLKPDTKVSPEDESDDEDEGRTAAFQSRRPKLKPNHVPQGSPDHDNSLCLSTVEEVSPDQTKSRGKDDQGRRQRSPKARTTASYLDELLSRKAMKTGSKTKGQKKSDVP